VENEELPSSSTTGQTENKKRTGKIQLNERREKTYQFQMLQVTL